jgi:hypothetical protein
MFGRSLARLFRVRIETPGLPQNLIKPDLLTISPKLSNRIVP